MLELEAGRSVDYNISGVPELSADQKALLDIIEHHQTRIIILNEILGSAELARVIGQEPKIQSQDSTSEPPSEPKPKVIFLCQAPAI